MKRIIVLGGARIIEKKTASYGERAAGFLSPQLASAYIPLEGVTLVVLKAHAAAFVIAPGVAVTNAHNQAIIGNASIIGQSRNYDLLFFHVDKNSELSTSAPSAGEGVIAYGQGASGELREARGIVMLLNALVEARCET